MKLIKIAISSFLVSLFVITGLAPQSTSALSVDNFYFSDFTADYYLAKTEDGTEMRVKETIVAEFPNYDQNKGIVRIIPRTNQSGKNLVLKDTGYTVTRNGQPEPIWESALEKDTLTISTGTDDYLRGTQTYVFEYKFSNVITDFTEYQELYWDVNGTGWSQEFRSVQARIHLDDDTIDMFTGDTECFTGAYGHRGDTCEYSREGNTLTFLSEDLSSYENLTFAVKFDPNSFNIPQPKEDNILYLLAAATLLLTAIFTVLAFLAYHKDIAVPKKRNQKFIAPQYIPLDGLTPTGAASIFASKYNATIAAEIIDLAVNGKIELIEQKSSGFLSRDKYTIRIVDLSDISKDQTNLLSGIAMGEPYANGQEITLPSKPKTFSQQMKATAAWQKYQNEIPEHLADQDLFYRKKTNRVSTFAVLQLVATIGSFIAYAVVLDSAVGVVFPELSSSLFFISMILAFTCMVILLILSAMSSKYFKLTDKGYEALNYLEGLKLYIKMAESDRIKVLQSPKTAERVPINTDDKKAIIKLYEKLLPYAMIFGLEKEWAKELQVYYETTNYQPTWYIGSNFRAAMFVSSINSLSNTARQAYGAGNGGGSSSSSGFGGGGFSGGGVGGGGGGGR